MTNGGATGPRTPEGKAVASRNALRHGLLSHTQVLPDEDEQVFGAFRDRLLAALNPDGDLEVLLADRAVLLGWRLQRLLRVEAGVFASYYFDAMEGQARAEVARHEVDPFSMLMERELIIKEPAGRDAALQALAEVREASRRREDARLARAFIRDAGEAEAFAKLARYETLAEIAAHEAGLEEIDVEGVLAFAEHVLLNAARLWMEFSLEQRQRLQQVLFPQGVSYRDGEFGTTETSLIFRLLRAEPPSSEHEASPAGFEPTLPA